jgi:hypothetical protein
MTNLIPSGDEIRSIEIMAKNAAESKFFAKLNGFGGIFSIAMFARELGLPVMQCLFGGMTNIEGKIEIAPRMMNAMIRKAGHQIQIVKIDDNVCILKGVRCDTGEVYECTYSLGEATKAGLANKPNWKNYASDMLFARCLSRLARRLFADVIGSAYVEGEIDVDSRKSQYQSESKMSPIDPEPCTVIEVQEVNDSLSEAQAAQIDLLVQEITDEEYLNRLKNYVGVEKLHEMKTRDFERTLRSLERKVEEMKGGQDESRRMA